MGSEFYLLPQSSDSPGCRQLLTDRSGCLNAPARIPPILPPYANCLPPDWPHPMGRHSKRPSRRPGAACAPRLLLLFAAEGANLYG